jgi:hypothetical protein
VTWVIPGGARPGYRGAVSADLSSVITAATRWLVSAYPPPGGALSAVLAEVQARQAVTVAAWLRYPTAMDAALVTLAGPGGSARLDWLVGADVHGPRPLDDPGHAWRSWVDETVVSWAAELLTVPARAAAAVAALDGCEHTAGTHREFRRLTDPSGRDRAAAALLRHPDLLEPVAALHRSQLLELLDHLGTGPAYR